MKVGGAICLQCEYFFTRADLRGPQAWILCTTPLYLFVPSRIGTVKLLSACTNINIFDADKHYN